MLSQAEVEALVEGFTDEVRKTIPKGESVKYKVYEVANSKSGLQASAKSGGEVVNDIESHALIEISQVMAMLMAEVSRVAQDIIMTCNVSNQYEKEDNKYNVFLLCSKLGM